MLRRYSFLFAALLIQSIYVQSTHAAEIPITDLSRLGLKNAQAEVVTYRGFPSLKLTEKESGGASGDTFATLKNTHFRNGAIDLQVSGTPAQGAGDFARGFIGVIFRLQPDGAHWEKIYVRPTNGRTPDQLRRNHTTQYVSFPDWPWERLRKESPGLYESYTDMLPGEWTHLRIVVHGTNASLYVGDASQPCLLVHDLKLGETEGSVALWIGPGTEGYFRDVRISPE